MSPRRIGLIMSVVVLAAVSCSDDSGAVTSTTAKISGGDFEMPSDLVIDEFDFTCTGAGGTVTVFAESRGTADATISLDIILPNGKSVEGSATTRIEIPVEWVDGGEYHVTRTYAGGEAVVGARYQAQGGTCE